MRVTLDYKWGLGPYTHDLGSFHRMPTAQVAPVFGQGSPCIISVTLTRPFTRPTQSLGTQTTHHSALSPPVVKCWCQGISKVGEMFSGILLSGQEKRKKDKRGHRKEQRTEQTREGRGGEGRGKGQNQGPPRNRKGAKNRRPREHGGAAGAAALRLLVFERRQWKSNEVFENCYVLGNGCHSSS